MNGQILKVATALVISVATVTAGAHGLDPMVRADIPFDFQVREHRLPAGRYMVARLTTGTLIIRSVETGKGVFFIVHGGKTEWSTPSARLVFRRYDDQYFLGSIWDGSGNTSQEVTRSAAEREAQKRQRRNLARHQAKLETVTVPAEAGD